MPAMTDAQIVCDITQGELGALLALYRHLHDHDDPPPSPNILDPLWIPEMAEQSVVFALANPDPEVDPVEAGKYAAVVASGRSDYPNQINNVLAFPGVFRGLLDARADEITMDQLLRAARAIAGVVRDDELNASFIIPTVFHPDVPGAVAAAIRADAGVD